MILLDVNVLVNANRGEQPHHGVALALVEEMVASPLPFAVSELVLSGFVRVVSNSRTMRPPTEVGDALAVCRALRSRRNARTVAPGPRHWAIFDGLCRTTGTTGPAVADAYHAALAIEHGCEWVSFDRDFGRFPGLHWRDPSS